MVPNIDVETIKMLSSSQTTFEKGKRYFQNGHVTSVIYDSTRHSFQARVEGSHAYQVIIEINKNNNLDYAECDCPAYGSFPGYCKHIVAAMLCINKFNQSKKQEIGDRPSNIRSLSELEIQNNTRIVENIIDRFQMSNSSTEVNGQMQKQLQVQYRIELSPAPSREVDQWLTLQMKAGCERLYVVKNAREFLNAYYHNEPLRFTKNFVYEPNIHRPSDEDVAMFRFLYDLLDSERMYEQLFETRSVGSGNKRFITIPPNQVGLFLELLPKGRFVLENEGESYTELPVAQGQCPITFSIDKEQDFFALRSQCGENEWNNIWQLVEPYLLSEDGYCFAQGNIYKLNAAQQDLILKLHREIQQRDEGKLLIYPEQMDHFASVVLPLLKKEAQLNIERPVAEQIVQYPLQTDIYFDRQWIEDQERITAKVVHSYGENLINPLQNVDASQRNDQILIRDTEKEQQIMNIFENAGFQYNGKELHLDDEEALFLFMHDKLPHLEDLADIYTTESMEKLMIEPSHEPNFQVEIDSTNRWLEFHFDMPEVSEDELQEILQAFMKRKSYVRLSDGAYVSLSSETQGSFHALLEEAGREAVFEDHKMKLPAIRALQFEEMLKKNDGLGVNKGQRFRRLIRNMKDPETLEFSPPASIAPVLRDYQLLGFQWLKTLSHYGFGGILADDMGLGKTLQTIAYIVSEIEQQKLVSKDLIVSKKDGMKQIPALVIVPASLVYNWEKECSHFAPQLKTRVIAGNKTERQEKLANIEDVEVLITSYPLLRRDIEYYENYFFQTLILDEAQTFKNQRSQTAQSIKRLHASACFALSGTPIENRLDELWSICDIVLPGLFPNQKRFRKLSNQQIAQRVRPFILRRLKQDVLTELPDKIETVQLLDLTADQKKLYLASLKQIQSDTKQMLQEDGFQKNRMKVLAGLTRLRQICCHPALYLGDHSADSGKFTYFFDILGDLMSNGHRVLVFSQFTSMLALMMEKLQKEKVPFHYLDGKTPGKERLDMVERFNKGEHDLFLISLRAGGTGLNLTGADTVILYDLWWNPAVEQQATDRAHRMGQKNKVQVFKLVSQGTIEEKIYELQQKKQALFESIIQPGEQMLSSLSEEDIKEILDLD